MNIVIVILYLWSVCNMSFWSVVPVWEFLFSKICRRSVVCGPRVFSQTGVRNALWSTSLPYRERSSPITSTPVITQVDQSFQGVVYRRSVKKVEGLGSTLGCRSHKDKGEGGKPLSYVIVCRNGTLRSSQKGERKISLGPVFYVIGRK